MSEFHRASTVAEQAAFQIAKDWEGTSTVLRFFGKVPPGKSVVLIGNYAGGERAIFSALQKTIGDEKSAPVHDLFKTHVERPSSTHRSAGNLLRTINQSLVDEILSRNHQRLWSDQVHVFNKLQSCDSSCIGLNGVAGCGKSLLGAACGIAISELSGNMERVVCIAKTRKMRDSLLVTFLSLLRNKERVLALGRPLDDEIDSNADEHLSIFDSDTRASIAKTLEPLKLKVEDLKKKLAELPNNMFCR